MTHASPDSARPPHQRASDPAPTREREARRTVTAIVLALVAVTLAYRLFVLKRVEHTSLVFVGLPALAALVVLQTRPQTAIGTINKVIAIALCLSAVLFGEGFVCILFAAPIFFLVGTVLGAAVNWLTRRRRGKGASGTRRRTAIAIAVLPFSLEGVVPSIAFPRDEAVTVTRTIPYAADAVRAALASPPRFDRELPPFLRLGFPTPAHTSGSGLDIGDHRVVGFRHGRHHSGSLVMTVTTSHHDSVRFAMTSDASYITHWLSWRDAAVRWESVGDGATRVTWTLRYRRRLDPAWYFAPLERYGVKLTAAYLIETLATPRAGAVSE